MKLEIRNKIGSRLLIINNKKKQRNPRFDNCIYVNPVANWKR